MGDDDHDCIEKEYNARMFVIVCGDVLCMMNYQRIKKRRKEKRHHHPQTEGVKHACKTREHATISSQRKD